MGQLNSLEDNHKIKYGEFIKEIEGLLPNATSAGLASDFSKERTTFAEPIKNWNRLFVFCMVAMLLITWITLINFQFTPLTISFIESPNWQGSFKSILQRLPLLAPLIWLAIYAGRRRSELQRLEQEYAHKEVLAKSYSSYKQQIEKLEGNDHKLVEKLLAASIDTIAYNASKSLDKKHRVATPSSEVLEGIKTLKKLASEKSKTADV